MGLFSKSVPKPVDFDKLWEGYNPRVEAHNKRLKAILDDRARRGTDVFGKVKYGNSWTDPKPSFGEQIGIDQIIQQGYRETLTEAQFEKQVAGTSSEGKAWVKTKGIIRKAEATKRNVAARSKAVRKQGGAAKLSIGKGTPSVRKRTSLRVEQQDRQRISRATGRKNSRTGLSIGS